MTSLRRRMTKDMQVRNLSSHTQATYVQQVLLFARHFNKSPEILGPEHIRSYQIYLTNEKKLAPSSIIIAVAALRFLYKITLHKNWNFQEVIPSPKKPQKLPMNFTGHVINQRVNATVADSRPGRKAAGRGTGCPKRASPALWGVPS